MAYTVSTRMLLGWLLAATGLLCCCSALRDVMLVMPPVARAGSTIKLQCLYNLEGNKLYAVKWYRGNFEFYRFEPLSNPKKMAFKFPDIHVDLSQSDDHQVTLTRVPLLLSGTFACEVSTEPNFTTFVKKGELQVLDIVRRPRLTVSKNVYRPGDELEANCTIPSPAIEDPEVPAMPPLSPMYPGRAVSLLPEQPPLQPHQLSAEQRRHLQAHSDSQTPTFFGFWVNNKPVPAALIKQGTSSATLRRPLVEGDFLEGQLRLKCVVTFADKYREPSHVVTVRRQEEEEEEEDMEEEEEEEEDGVEEPPVVVTEANSVQNAIDAPVPADRSTGAGAGAAGPASHSAFVGVLTAVAMVVLQMELNIFEIKTCTLMCARVSV